MTAPLLSSEDRTACGHGAALMADDTVRPALCAAVSRLLASTLDTAEFWLERQHVHPRSAELLAANLAKIGVLADVFQIPVDLRSVGQIEAAIALPEAK